MKLLFFSQFYQPEYIAASYRASANSSYWAEMGHDVTVFTGYPNYPTGKVFPGYETRRLLSAEETESARVLRSKIISASNANMFGRLVNALSFYFFGRLNFLLNRKSLDKNYHLVLGTSGPIFAALLAWDYARTRRLPFVLELRDISYVQLQAGGRKNNALSVRVMKALELHLCKKAKAVIVVTEGFRDILVEEGVPAEKISVITNGADVLETVSASSGEDGLTLSYFGTMGISQDLTQTFDYADLIRRYCENFRYVLIGEGARKTEIAEALRRRDCPYVSMLDGMSAENLETYYRLTRLSIVSLKKTPFFRDTIPSKLFQIMSRGIAVLFIGPEGEAASIVRRRQCGIALTGTPEEDCAILEAFFRRSDWKARLQEMGNNGANAVRECYSRFALAKRYAEILEDAAGAQRMESEIVR